MTRRNAQLSLMIGALVLTVGLLWSTLPLTAQDTEKTAEDKPSNAYCLLCHSEPDQGWVLPSGETLSLMIDPAELARSVHGEANPDGPLICADCHTNHRFPHPPSESQSVREFQLERYPACRECHQEQYTRAQDSVHGAALRSGRQEAAICIDCHGGHDIQPPDEPHERISLTCGKCHGTIFEEYRNSVHGMALLEENNPDVPTCIDCHGVHDIQNPTASLFRVRSPQLCARCHADTNLMAKYGIRTDVFQSYLTDFHGTTVALFEQQDPTVATNKAVCYDCHGVHNILAVHDDTTHALRENLLETCKECHPDATANFPDAWMGHYPATPESQPLLFAFTGFYNILIVGVVGTALSLIVTDLIRRIRQRLTRN